MWYEIGSLIRKRRQHLKLTYGELGRKSGTRIHSIQSYEKNNIKNMSVEKLIKIADALDVKMSYFFGENNFDKLKNHVGHNIVCVNYKDQNMAIECETCNEVLVDYER